MSDSADITRLLNELNQGESGAADKLFPLLYDELHKLAGRYFGRERRDHTLQTTALVHEAYLRLAGQREVEWQSRTHFLAIAALIMRRVLVSYARDHGRVKRHATVKVELDDAMATCEQRSVEMLEIDEALDRLATLDARQARLVELRFFGGLSVEESAEVLQISPATVKRQWNSARAWLAKEIGKGSRAQAGGADA